MPEVPTGARYAVEPLRPRAQRSAPAPSSLWEREPRTWVGLLAVTVWILIAGTVLVCEIAGVSVPEMFAALHRFAASLLRWMLSGYTL